MKTKYSKKLFDSTIDAICSRRDPLDPSRMQILLIKNKDTFYLPNGFKSYKNEKPEIACVRGLCNIFSLSQFKQMANDPERQDMFYGAFSVVNSKEVSKSQNIMIKGNNIPKIYKQDTRILYHIDFD